MGNPIVNMLVAGGVVGVLGLIFGAALSLIGQRFEVPVNPLTAAVRALLPGANCGACGHPGCDDYAAAVAEGREPPDRCPVGCAALAARIAEAVSAAPQSPATADAAKRPPKSGRSGVYNGFFLCVRVLARPFTYLHHRPDLSQIPDTAIYICRHRNLRGPIFTMLHLNRQMRPWVFNVFCDRKLCYLQYSDYTFTERLGWPRWWAEFVARLASWVVPSMMRAIGAIPVHRGGVIKQTFKQSLEALLRGESVIIYPDVEYTSTSDEPGEMYSGYVALAQMYFKATGKEIRFIPLDVRMKQRAIYLGESATYRSGSYLREERVRVSGLLKSELERLGAIEDAAPGKVGTKRAKL